MGHKTQKVLENFEIEIPSNFNSKPKTIETIGDLHKIEKLVLQNLLGPKTGKTIYQNSRGIDKRLVQDLISQQISFGNHKKSVSVDINWGLRFKNFKEVLQTLEQIAEEVAKKMKISSKLEGNKITFKILLRSKAAPIKTKKFLGCGYCDSFSRSKEMKNGVFTNDFHVICNVAKMLLTQILENDLFSAIPDIRGMGISVSGMRSEAEPSEEKEKNKKKKPVKAVFIQENEAITLLDAFLVSKPKQEEESQEEEEKKNVPKLRFSKKRKKIEDFFKPLISKDEETEEKTDLKVAKKRKLSIFDWNSFTQNQILDKEVQNLELISSKFQELDENNEQDCEKLENLIFGNFVKNKEFSVLQKFFSSGNETHSAFFLDMKTRVNDFVLKNYQAHLFPEFIKIN